MTELDFFAEMAVELQAEPTAEATIERIVEYAQAAIHCPEAGIILVHSRQQIETAAATSDAVAQAHDLQLVHDEGPYLDAIVCGNAYVTNNTAEDNFYPRWGKAVADLGLRSAMSVPLATKRRVYGSLNLFSNQINAFDENDVEVTKIFGRHAAVAWANAHDQEGLHAAIDARNLIGQAQGILMQRYDIDADRAFDFLRRHSQDRNIKLHAVAQWVVDNRCKSLENPLPHLAT